MTTSPHDHTHDQVITLHDKVLPYLFNLKQAILLKGVKPYQLDHALICNLSKTIKFNVTITKLQLVTFKKLTEQHAVQCGYANLTELKSTLLGSLETIDPAQKFTLIHFVKGSF